MASSAEPRGEKNIFCANLGGEKLLKFVEKCRRNIFKLTFFKHVSDRFSDLFSRFSNRFSCRFKSFSGAVSFCRRAALILLGNGRNTVSRVLFREENSLSFTTNSVSSAKSSVSSLWHTNNRLRGTDWVLFSEVGEGQKTHWVRCLKPYSPKPYSGPFPIYGRLQKIVFFLQAKPSIQGRTWQDLTRFSPLNFSLLSPGFRGLVLLNRTSELEKKQKKSSGEPPVETAPRNCRFLSLVVVELVLTHAHKIPGFRGYFRFFWGVGVPKGPSRTKITTDSKLTIRSKFATAL